MALKFKVKSAAMPNARVALVLSRVASRYFFGLAFRRRLVTFSESRLYAKLA